MELINILLIDSRSESATISDRQLKRSAVIASCRSVRSHLHLRELIMPDVHSLVFGVEAADQ